MRSGAAPAAPSYPFCGGRQMTAVTTDTPVRLTDSTKFRAWAEAVAIPVGALVASALIFSMFLIFLGKSPVDYFQLLWKGGFGTSFSIQNTLQRAAPLILCGLAFAIPAQIGLTMIGAEGALVLGGFSAAAIAIPLVSGGVPVVLTMPTFHTIRTGTKRACRQPWSGILRNFRNWSWEPSEPGAIISTVCILQWSESSS